MSIVDKQPSFFNAYSGKCRTLGKVFNSIKGTVYSPNCGSVKCDRCRHNVLKRRLTRRGPSGLVPVMVTVRGGGVRCLDSLGEFEKKVGQKLNRVLGRDRFTWYSSRECQGLVNFHYAVWSFDSATVEAVFTEYAAACFPGTRGAGQVVVSAGSSAESCLSYVSKLNYRNYKEIGVFHCPGKKRFRPQGWRRGYRRFFELAKGRGWWFRKWWMRWLKMAWICRALELRENIYGPSPTPETLLGHEAVKLGKARPPPRHADGRDRRTT